MNQGEDGVGGVVAEEQRFCSECYGTLLSSEKCCPKGCIAEIKVMPAVTLEEAIVPSNELATENPNPFYGSFGCQLKPAGCRTNA